MGTDLMTLAIGAGIGAMACYALHMAEGGRSHGRSAWLQLIAKSYVAFGHDLARSGYNTSEVWDFRDRLCI